MTEDGRSVRSVFKGDKRTDVEGNKLYYVHGSVRSAAAQVRQRVVFEASWIRTVQLGSDEIYCHYVIKREKL